MGIGGSLISGASNLIGGLLGNRASKQNIKKQIQYQKTFAQHGIRWKVNDAIAAGIHPLAALGANTVSFNPVYTGSNQLDYGISRMGQDIGRAIESTKTKEEKELARLQIAQERQQLKGLELHNRQTELEINRKEKNFPSKITSKMGIQESDLPPDWGQNSPLYQTKPLETSERIGVQKGTGPEGMFKHSRMGFLKYYPNEEAMDLISESIPASISWWSDMASYKWAVSRGKANPKDKKLSSFYKREKAKIERQIGRAVEWHPSMRWRIKNWQK